MDDPIFKRTKKEEIRKARKFLERVPSDAAKTELLERLAISYCFLSSLSSGEIEQFLKEEVGPRFGLTDEDLLEHYEYVQDFNEVKPEPRKGKKVTANTVIDFLSESGASLFRDEFGDAFVRLPMEGHYEVLKIRGKRFRSWLAHQYWQMTQKMLSNDKVNSLRQTISAMALFEGEKYTLKNRVAFHDGCLWYDLTNSNWEAVKITDEGWEVVETPPILFRRYEHQKEQAAPVSGTEAKRLLDFVNITDEHQQVLLMCLVVSYFIPDFPHPLIIPHGQQGTAKSTMIRVVRSLIDPSAIELLSLPEKEEELVQQLSHHWFLPYDNVTNISDKISDSLCRAVTGSGFSKRELYTDDDDVIYSFRRCVGVNAINIMAKKPDLLERSVLIELNPIPEKNRKLENEFWTEFDSVKPGILGGIFSVLSGALREYKTVKLDEHPRMADFAKWGCSIAISLGYGKEKFLAAYAANRAKQNEEAIKENPVAAAVYAHMCRQDEWKGTATDLLEALEGLAEVEKINVKDSAWPKSPSALSRKLREVSANLSAVGVEVFPSGNRGYWMYKKKLPSDGEENDNDGINGISATSEDSEPLTV